MNMSALWFTSTEFGDDKDRVVEKHHGEWTYVAADIAYLQNKAERGYDTAYNGLGHDHHSYATRLQAECFKRSVLPTRFDSYFISAW